MRRFIAQKRDATPAEVALYARLMLFGALGAGATIFHAIGFFALGRTVAGVITACAAVFSSIGLYVGRQAKSLAAMQRIATAVVFVVFVSLTAICFVTGEVGQVTAWYVAATAASTVLLLPARRSMLFIVAAVAVVWIAPEVRVYPGGAYERVPWEVPFSQVSFVVLFAMFAAATRRATDVHVSTLVAHDSELKRHNARLAEAVQEQTRIQEELELAHAQASSALGAAQRAREITEEARRLAEEANRAKSRFLANMSHELRTPLNAVIGYSELIAEELAEDSDPALVEDVARIRTAGRHLLRLINDLLDLAKVEAGRSEIHLEHFSFAQVVEDAVDTVRPAAAENGNTIEVDLAEDLGGVWSDADRVRQILVNLAANACKFTRDGHVEVAAHPDGEFVVVSVSDNGIGMTPAELDVIFEPFRQADASTTRKFGGTGLGLSIVRNYAELLGAEIAVESEAGEGSTFWVRFPREARPRQLAISGVQPVVDDTRPGLGFRRRQPGRTLLAVSADNLVRDLVVRLLEPLGYFVITAPAAASAIAVAEDHDADVVVIDADLPDASGWSLVAALRANASTAAVPTVMLVTAEERELVQTMGASAAVAKPVTKAALVDTLGDVGVGVEAEVRVQT